MLKRYTAYQLGDMCLSYDTDEQGHIGMLLTPWGKPFQQRCALEPLIQWHFRGDCLPAGYGNGITLAGTNATDQLRFLSQERTEQGIVTTLQSENGCIVHHRVIWHDGLEAVRIQSEVINASSLDRTLEMVTSANLGGLSPFMEGEGVGALMLHRARSAWSAEGRLITQRIEELQLERSWTGHAVRVEKFGQLGSMPVHGYFPFAAVEDRSSGVIWAMQLACPTSWQFELRRKDDGLSMSCGLADTDFGHWYKTLKPGETLALPEAYLTVGEGGVDRVAQRLLSIHRDNLPNALSPLPVLFNEYCTTWGNPSHQNLASIAKVLRGHDVDYFVIDCGWYGKPGVSWSECSGDWLPNEDELFPEGLCATAAMIRNAGFKPGLWFEPETCARHAEIFHREDMLLRRHGVVLDTDNRRFLDLRQPKVQKYLNERVIGLLKSCGFAYVKIDYNDTVGTGCDGAESLGEGLRQVGLESLRLFRSIREQCPDILIENCASGGHRLEPSYMAVSDMASFSDAHECLEIPIIAANLHRLILPCQEQIWAVLRADDSLRRINCSLVNTLLGVMCLSGDIHHLSDEQWALVDRGIAFYRSVSPIIENGISTIHQHLSASWRKPEGWQAVVRRGQNGQALVLVHTFGGDLPPRVTLPVQAGRIVGIMCSEQNQVALSDNLLTVELKAPFEAVAIHLTA